MHTYSVAGNYTVNLTASNGNGTNSTFATVTVLEEPVLPVANFSSNVTSGSAPLSVQFTDSSENATGWNWDFGDGFNSTEQNPAHTYSIAGNYTVNLTVSNLNGTDSKLATITVSEEPVLPVANFSSNVTNGSAPLSVQFNDSSLNATGWNWNFGDGFNSTEQNPVHTYSAAGNYTVNLTVSNGNGTNYTSASINVIEPVLPYHFVTTWGSSGSSNGSFNYPYGVSVDSSGNVYVADTGNNRIQKFDSSGNFITTWGSSGSGNGNFSRPGDVAVDAFGNVYVADTDNNRIQKFDSSGNFISTWGSSGSGNGMFSSPYGVSVDSSGNVYVGDTFNHRIQKFDSSGNFITAWGSYGSNNGNFIYPSGVSVDPSGNVYISDTSNNRIQKFDSSGNFISTWGSSGSGNGMFVSPYGVSVDSSGNVYVADTINSRIQKFDSSGNFITAWGSPGSDNGRFNYPSGVSVDSSGNVYISDTYNNRIQKFSTLVFPVANFSSNVSSGYVPLSVQFTDSSENTTGWNWDFGDGFNSTEQNPAHTYSIAGNYTVNLTVSNLNGTDSKIATITVSEEPVLPVANFNSNVSSGSAPLSVQFTDSSLNATAWNWDFGDGFNSPEQNPAYTYSTAGNYTVNLTASNLNGTDSKLATITVSEEPVLPVANFSRNVTNGYAPLSVQFTDLSENTTGLNWDFGDGFNSTEQNPVHTYSVAGNYTVNLTVNNLNGTDSKLATITVSEEPVIPVANFSSNVSSGSAPLSVQFTDSSLNATGWNWDFGDGFNSTEQNPAHTYSVAGNYTVNLTASNGNGTNSTFATITVSSPPSGPNKQFAYTTNYLSNSVSVIDIATNTVTATVSVGSGSNPYGVAVNPAGTKVYVANGNSNSVSVIDTATNTVTATVPVGSNPYGVAVNPAGTKVYVANGNNVSVIDTSTNTVTATVPEGSAPQGVAVNPTGTRAYVTDMFSDNVSVIDTSTNTVTAYVTVGSAPQGVAVNPTGTKAYVANQESNNVSVIDTSTNTVTASVPVGSVPYGVAVNPTGTKAYVANYFSNTVSVIDTSTNTVIATVPVGNNPIGVSVNPDGTRAYVANSGSSNVSVIDTSTNAVTASVPVGSGPIAFGQFICSVPVQEPVLPVANFSSNVTSGSAPLSVQFTDSSLNATGWNWDFGDGFNSTEQNPVHTYSIAGNYAVNLTVSNGNGTNSTFATITVLEYNPAYRIDKIVTDVSGNGSSANVTRAGDVISYQININNTGNIDLTNVTVTDPLVGNLTGPSGDDSQTGVLNAEESWTFTGTYTVTQADLNSNGGGDGFINNTATVDCAELDPQSDTITVPIKQISACDINKMVIDVAGKGPEGNISSAGEVVQFQVNVTNTGNVDLTNISVHDSLINLTGPYEERNLYGFSQSMQTFQALQNAGDVLAVGETWIYLGNYTVTQEDLNNNGEGDGFLNSTVTFDSDQTEPINDSTIIYGNESGNETGNESIGIHIERNPASCIYKSVIEVDNGGDCIVDDAGDIIRYRIVVKNEGNVDLTNVSVNDTLTTLTGPDGDEADPGVLNLGEVWKFYGNYTVTQEDLNNNGGGDGDIDNTASVSCSELPDKTASISQPISQYAYLRIYKSAIGVDNAGDCIANKAGDIIEYQIAVKNEGKIDLTGVSVIDPLISLKGPVESKSADGVLRVGELWAYTGKYTVTQADIDSNGGGDGDIDNTAIVTCSELPNATSSIGVPLVITRTDGKDTGSESNNTSTDNGNSVNPGTNTDNDPGSSGGRSHSSSGSGGASLSPESAKNVEVKEISQAFVTSGNSVKFNFPKNATSVTHITFDAKKTAGKTTTIVEMLKGKSSLASTAPSGEVYKYLNIWVGNSGFANPMNIENAVIDFRVEKAWIKEKGIEGSSIFLNRYSDEKWNELPTSLSGEDGKYLYFTAKSPGFSVFSITAKTAAEGSDIEVHPKYDTDDVDKTGDETSKPQANEETSGKNASKFGLISLIVFLLMAGLAVVFLYKRRQEEQK